MIFPLLKALEMDDKIFDELLMNDGAATVVFQGAQFDELKIGIDQRELFEELLMHAPVRDVHVIVY